MREAQVNALVPMKPVQVKKRVMQVTGFERSARMGRWIQGLWAAHPSLQPQLLQHLHRLADVSEWQCCLAAACAAADLPNLAQSPVQACPHQGGPCPTFLLSDVVIKFYSEVRPPVQDMCLELIRGQG